MLKIHHMYIFFLSYEFSFTSNSLFTSACFYWFTQQLNTNIAGKLKLSTEAIFKLTGCNVFVTFKCNFTL